MVGSTKIVKVGAFGSTNISKTSNAQELNTALDKAYIHQLSYRDYRIQTNVPEHINSSQLFGTQVRKLIMANIQMDDYHYESYLREAPYTSKGLTRNKPQKITINKSQYTDEFRRLQTESSRLSEEDVASYHSGEHEISDSDRGRLAGIYERLLSEGNGSRQIQWTDLSHKGNHFKVASVSPEVFHDIFEVNRKYLGYGELVDLHESYEGAECFISSDGLSGFAIEPDGNLVSVFNLGSKKGFLSSIAPFIKEQGATKLDAYASDKQNLAKIYQKTLGFKVASSMDYNMEYDHDNIADNHGNQTVAMIYERLPFTIQKATFRNIKRYLYRTQALSF